MGTQVAAESSYASTLSASSLLRTASKIWKSANGRGAKNLSATVDVRQAAMLLISRCVYCFVALFCVLTLQHWSSVALAASSERGGQIVFVDLVTEDPKAARDFYGKLFDWRFVARTNGLGEYVIQNAGIEIGELVRIKDSIPDEPETQWVPVMAIGDVVSAVDAATRLGGKIIVGLSDDFASGKHAVLRDAEGALIAVYTGNFPRGARKRVGDWIWFDLLVSDRKRASDFYLAVGSMQTRKAEDDGMSPFVMGRNGKTVAGVVSLPNKSIKPTWLAYVGVTNIADTIAKAVSLGAILVAKNKDAAILIDPLGAGFGIQRVSE